MPLSLQSSVSQNFRFLSSLIQCHSEFAKRVKLCKVTIHFQYFPIQNMRHGRKRVVVQILLPIKWSEKNLNVSHVFLESKRTVSPEVPLCMEDETGLVLYHLTDYSLSKVMVNLTNSHVSSRELFYKHTEGMYFFSSKACLILTWTELRRAFWGG